MEEGTPFFQDEEMIGLKNLTFEYHIRSSVRDGLIGRMGIDWSIH